MTVQFVGNFSKRRNSTKQPVSGTSKTVVLKEGTSMMKPAFLLSSALYTWNYAIWDGRYYYITDIVAESNTLFRVECELDVMATFKSAIGNYSTMIARAASDQDFDVVDSIYPAKTRPITKRTAISNPGIFTTNRSSGCYIIGTIGGAGQHFYVFTPGAFALFCIKLFPQLSVSNIDTWIETQISQATVGGLGTILQNIVLMKWLPVAYSSVSALLTSVSSVKIGNFVVEASAGELSANTTIQLLGTLIQFPDRDDAGARGRWLYLSPFASYSVYIPPFGMINVDPAFIPGAGRELVADIMCEVVSGNVTLRLYYSTGYSGPKMIGVYNANVSQDLRAGGSSANVGGVVGGLVGAAAAYAADSSGGIISGIASAVSSATPSVSQVGGGVSGPSPDLGSTWYAYATYFDPIDEDQAEFGRPLGEVKAINTLSGYVKCANASLAIPGHVEEMSEINGILNSGFFYE